MKEKQKQFILRNADKLSVSGLAQELGLTERSVKKFLARKDRLPKTNGPFKGFFEGFTGIGQIVLANDTNNRKIFDLVAYYALFLLALAVRTLYLNQIRTSPLFEPFYRGLDDYLYDTWAREIASGKIVGNTAFYGLPLYPYFLAFIYKFVGYSVYWVKFIQMIFGALGAALFYKLGKSVANRTVGIIMALIMTLYLPAIFTEGLMASSSISVFLNTLVLLLAMSFISKPAWYKFAFIGLLTGIASLANASILLFLIIFSFWRLFNSKRSLLSGFRDVILGAFFCSLAIAPATIHNYLAAKDIVPVTYHGGLTFFAGNNLLTKGSFSLPPELGTNVVDTRDNAAMIAEKISKKPLKPSEISAFWFDQGVRFIKENPFKYGELVARKAALFWNGNEIPDILSMGFMKRYSVLLRFPLPNYAFVAPLSLLGVLLLFPAAKSNNYIKVMYIYLISIFMSTLIYFVNSRYVLTAIPAQAFFAAAGIYGIYVAIKRSDKKTLAFTLLILLLIFGFTQIKLLDFNFAQVHNNLGIVLKRKGMLNEAITEYSSAIALNDKYPSPHYNLGILYAEQGKIPLAIDCFNKAIEISPSMYVAHNELADLCFASGQTSLAVQHLKSSLKINPDQPEVRSALNMYDKS